MKDFTIKQTADILGVHRDTIKYWEENGLIPPARRNPKNGYRVYNAQDIKEIARNRGISEVDVNTAIKRMQFSKS
jgi:DNA-binding transcriptional MerR regulator